MGTDCCGCNWPPCVAKGECVGPLRFLWWKYTNYSSYKNFTREDG